MKSFLRLLSYIRNYKLNVVLNIICNILMVFFSILGIPALIPFLQVLLGQEELPQVAPASLTFTPDGVKNYFYYHLGHIIQTHGREQALIFLCISLALIYFFLNLFRYLSLYFITPMRNGIVRDLRQQLIDRTLVLPLSYFSEERKGDLMSRITSDVQEVEWSILNVLEAVVREPLMIAGALGFMIYLSPSLTLFVLILIVFTAIVIGGIGKVLKRQSNLVQAKMGDLVSITEETLSGLRIIKGFNAERYQSDKFLKENNQYRQYQTQALRRRDLSSPLSEFMGISIVSVLIWYGYREVQAHSLSVSEFLAFLFAFFRVIDPAKSFSTAFYHIQKGIAALQRVQQILDAEVNIQDPEAPKSFRDFTQAIEYRNVVFSYRNSERNALNGINLIIPKGKIIALVGASGAGKSTIADLLPRFYDPSSGAILIDGTDIREYTLRDLRSHMGIVSQEAILFNDTIYNNIVFGMEGVEEEQVIDAARAANAHDFIMAAENGYQTNIGDRGLKLSGGQRQRLTIARALLRNPAILILDEATSALDSESEKLVQEALNRLMKDRTAIVIAHRLSTIQHADEIIVLKDGAILERGSNDELLKMDGGEYQKLVMMQTL